jgi:zinc transport system substrate-binding protein
MAGVGEPHLLVRGGASPHSAALKPSDARALAGAELVFWIGAGLESFLERPLRALAGEARVVGLAAAEGIELLPLRAGGAWGGHDDHAAEAAAADMHLWLDPRNAIAMVEVMAAQLAAVDPQRADLYRANAAALKDRLAALDRELAALLRPVAGKPYVVFHDSYRYLEARYGLAPVGSITVSPERAPGAARLSGIRHRIRASGAACVFVEPQFSPRLVGSVVAGTGARTATLDPMGAALADGPELYFELLRANAAALRGCLLAQG